MSKWAIRSKKRVICSFVYFWQATWMICSQLLIFGGRLAQIAHGRSLLVSNLSDSLSVAHLSWAIWANCSQLLIKMSNFEQMSGFPTLIIPRPLLDGLPIFMRSSKSTWWTKNWDVPLTVQPSLFLGPCWVASLCSWGVQKGHNRNKNWDGPLTVQPFLFLGPSWVASLCSWGVQKGFQ